MLNNIVALLGNGAGGGGGSFESIATVTASGGETSLTFSSIPSTYKHLQIRMIAKSTTSGTASATTSYITFNGDAGANYASHNLVGNGSAVSAVGNANTGAIDLGSRDLPYSGTGQTSVFGALIADILDYSNTSKFKTARMLGGSDWNSATTNAAISMASGLWRSTAAVSSIQIYPGSGTYAAGTTFALYGIKGE